MILTHIILTVTITLFFLFLLYAEFIIFHKHGKALLVVNLKNRNRLDGSIFIILITILFYHYTINGGDNVSGLLLIFLFMISCYLYFIRSPKFILKTSGFFYCNLFFIYDHITEINLTQNGILILKLNHKKIHIHVNYLDDLEQIYKTLIAINYSKPNFIQ